MDTLYHYTDLLSAREIAAEGVIRARGQTIYRDLLPSDDPARRRELDCAEEPVAAAAQREQQPSGYSILGAALQRAGIK